MLRDHRGSLVHSSFAEEDDDVEQRWMRGSLFFKLSEKVFVFGDLDWMEDGLMSVWATTLELAQAEHGAWRAKYLKRSKRRNEPACFHLLSMTERGMRTQR